MPTMLVVVTKTQAPTPAGQTFASTTITTTDSAGAIQTASVTGLETPLWSASFSNIAVGTGFVALQDIDTTGASIGSAVQVPFDTGGEVTNFAQSTGATITFS